MRKRILFIFRKSRKCLVGFTSGAPSEEVLRSMIMYEEDTFTRERGQTTCLHV